jgi:uncharacterized membrane protein
MASHERSIEVAVPLTTAYDQWTQFEDFPQFMEGVEEVRQLNDTLTHWRVSIGGTTREFDAEITEQRPDERVAWRAVEGTTHAGLVTFAPVDATATRVTLHMELDPEGLVEKAGEVLGVIERRIKGDLERYKEFIESRQIETGAWRDEVPPG